MVILPAYRAYNKHICYFWHLTNLRHSWICVIYVRNWLALTESWYRPQCRLCFAPWILRQARPLFLRPSVGLRSYVIKWKLWTEKLVCHSVFAQRCCSDTSRKLADAHALLRMTSTFCSTIAIDFTGHGSDRGAWVRVQRRWFAYISFLKLRWDTGSYENNEQMQKETDMFKYTLRQGKVNYKIVV